MLAALGSETAERRDWRGLRLAGQAATRRKHADFADA